MIEQNFPLPLEEIFNQYLLPLPEKVQVAIALIHGEKKQFVGAERTNEGIVFLDNRQAVFEIGSISKVFAATLLAQAVEQGHVSLETPVQSLLPFKLRQSGLDGIEIGLKHLANHTSGIAHHQPPGLTVNAILRGRPWVPFQYFTEDKFEKYLQRGLKLAATPGARYFYSNIGMSLAGYALATHSGQSYDEMIHTRIFQPLGMNLSAMQIAAVKEHILPGWRKAGVRAPNWDFYALSPAGGVKTCVEDLVKFVQAQFSNSPAVNMTQTPTYKINANSFVGLGWHISDRPQGERWLNHGGGTLGYSANVVVNVNKSLAVILLSNLGNGKVWPQKTFELCRDILQKLESAAAGIS
jgi:CubicO group peptidase (beta-lactamase class C family)